MKKWLLLLVVTAFLACSKDDKISEADQCERFVPGNVMVGVKGNAAIESVFAFFNSKNLKIKQMSGFDYTSPWPQDSIPTLEKRLMEKPYMNVWGISIGLHYVTRVINISNMFWDMDIDRQRDWVQTVRALQLADAKGDYKYVLLEVPVGKEVAWVNRLKKEAIFTWAQPNCFSDIRPDNP